METRGLPLLSGPPPMHNDSSRSEPACRKCGREFSVLFSRSKRCNHCGYLYCNSCTDYQALMPRIGDISGYVVMPVCAYCIDFLTVTAGGRGFLRSLPISRLRKYAEVYNIKVDWAVEKDDLINGILAARGANGCVSFENEEYYRKYSVPNPGRVFSSRSRGMFSRSSLGSDSPPSSRPPPPPPNRPPMYNFPRPDLAPDSPPRPPPQHEQSTPPPPPVPPRPYTSGFTHDNYTASTPPPPPPRPEPPLSSHFDYQPPFPPSRPPRPPPQWRSTPSPPPAPNANHFRSPFHPPGNLNVPPTESTPRTYTTSASAQPTALTLDDLLSMTTQSISTLSISVLKGILLTNHVNAGLILEKGELVVKVQNLVEEERRNRERQQMAEEAEELDRQERERELTEDQERVAKNNTDHSDDTTPPSHDPKPKSAPSSLGREGLCVVCYDNDANIAIVDCGHLAMCRGCSELIMASSRECPLCRTRIVTESRLLRIFKT